VKGEGGRGKERGECEGQGGRRGKEEVGGKKERGRLKFFPLATRNVY